MIGFLLHDSKNGGVATWTKFAIKSVGERDSFVIDNDSVGRDLKKISFSNIVSVWRLIKKHEISVLVVGNSVPSLIARIVKFLQPRLKIIYVTHGWGWSYQKGIKKIISFLIEFITMFLVNELVSVSTRDQRIAKKYFLRNSTLIPNVSMKDIVCKRSNRGIKKVLFIGRNSYPKRLDLFEELSKSFKDLKFFVIGETKDDKSNLRYLGELRDFEDYGSFDALVFLSESEGSPLVLLEALEAGLPCLVNRIDYLRDIEKDWLSSLYICEELTKNSIKSKFEEMLISDVICPDVTHKLMNIKREQWITSIRKLLN